MGQVREGLTPAQVLHFLGSPDVVYQGDVEAGIDFSWGYHERLPDHRDLIINFAQGLVCVSWFRDVPDPEQRRKCRELGRAY